MGRKFRFPEEYQLISTEGMTHRRDESGNEIDFGKDYQWVSKPLGIWPVGNSSLAQDTVHPEEKSPR